MNLKGFKKVQEDEQKAVLKNQHGHSITIAKKALPKAHLEALKKLPLHAAEGEVAQGNASDASLAQNIGQQFQMPIEAEDKEDTSSDSSTPEAQAPSREPQAEANPNATGDETSDAAMQGNTTTGPGGIPLASAQNVNAAEYEMQPKQQALNKQAVLWDQDLNNGHVTPQTYSDLFGKKDTLGKIGTLFGLLVSGAGAGLTHQPNAVMEMMNKEIDRDLEAQKQSKTNAQNFLKIYQNGALNEATINRYAAENNLTHANARNVLAQAAFTEAKNRILGTAPHYVGTLINKMPNGPQKQQALGAHALLQQGAAAEINQNNRKTAESEYNARTAQMQQQSTFIPELGKQVEYRESHIIPSVGTATRPVTGADADRVLKINNFQNLLQEAQALNKQAGLTGQISPAMRTRIPQLKNDLISSYNDVKGLNRFTKNEENLYDKIIPDIGSSLGNITGSTQSGLDRLQSSVAQKKDLEYKQLGIHPFDGGESEAPQQTQKEQTGISKSGKPIVLKNGKWMYK